MVRVTRALKRLQAGGTIVALALWLVALPAPHARSAGAAVSAPTPSKIDYIVEATARRVSELKSRGLHGPALSRRESNDIVHVRADGKIELLLHASGPVSATQVAGLTALGAEVEANLSNLSVQSVHLPSFGMVQAWVPASALQQAVALPWVTAVTPPDYPFSNTVGFGSIVSEGVTLHKADAVQDPRGITGAGVTIGAMSDGVAHLSDSQTLGELPNSVQVLNAGSGDEGTAILEILADMAPQASLVFSAVGGSLATYVNSLNGMVTAGANVITHDIALDAEPAFEEGLAAQTADNIAAAGVAFHSSSGNRAQNHAARVLATGTGQKPDNTSNSFTGCTDTPDNVVAIAPNGDTTFDVTLGKSASFTLQWSEPRAIFPTAGQGGFTDLNLYLMDQGLTTCLAQSVGVQANGQGDTIEQIGTGSSLNGVQAKLVVDVQATSTAVAPPILDLRWRGASPIDTPTAAGSLDPNENMTGLAAAVGAVYQGTDGLEGFSSQGPVTIATTTQCPGGAPGPCTGVAGPAPVTFHQPFWVGADGVSVSGVGGFGSPFFGTSAAAPHAAGCDALLRSSPLFSANAAPAATNARLAATADFGDGQQDVTGAGTLDCLSAVNRPPTADPGGPYTTDEGVDIVLDGTASSDPDTGDSIASYAWDLDDNGSFETSGASPTFDLVGQDGTFTVWLRVTDQAGATATASTTVTVNNVAPTVAFTAASPVDENQPTSISGSVTDPGWEDPLTETIDFGDGAGASPLSGSYSSTAHVGAALTFSTTHVYGDNSSDVSHYTVEICGSDDDTTTCLDHVVHVDNVAPDAVIDHSTLPFVGGVVMAHAGDTLHFKGDSYDPGSDDRTTTWDFGDGTVVSTTSLNNPAFNPDPPNSPEVNPRTVTDLEDHSFTACLYDVQFSATDDDAGASPTDSVDVVIRGTATRAFDNGYWKKQYGGTGGAFDIATLNCYLDIANFMSSVFSEVRDAHDIPSAFLVLKPPPGIDPRIRDFDRELLTAWLNFANGGIDLTDQVGVYEEGARPAEGDPGEVQPPRKLSKCRATALDATGRDCSCPQGSGVDGGCCSRPKTARLAAGN